MRRHRAHPEDLDDRHNALAAILVVRPASIPVDVKAVRIASLFHDPWTSLDLCRGRDCDAVFGVCPRGFQPAYASNPTAQSAAAGDWTFQKSEQAAGCRAPALSTTALCESALVAEPFEVADNA